MLIYANKRENGAADIKIIVIMIANKMAFLIKESLVPCILYFLHNITDKYIYIYIFYIQPVSVPKTGTTLYAKKIIQNYLLN